MHEFSQKGIIEFLHQKAVCDCMDVRTLSETLGTISPRMIRKYTASGDLKPIYKDSTMYVYRCGDIADWLIKFPRYFFMREKSQIEMTDEKYKELNAIIRRQVFSHWRETLLKQMDIDDICSEVICNILRKRYNGRVTDNVLVSRELSKLWGRISKRIDTVTYDPTTYNIANEEEEDA